MSLVFGDGPTVTEHDIEDWKTHLERMYPIIEMLTHAGLSVGEALIVIELNSLASHLCDIKKSLYEPEDDL